MKFSKKTFLCGAGMLLIGLAAGIFLGKILSSPTIGCLESDLTPLPDTAFADSPPASSVSSAPEPAPEPEKWVCLTFDDGPSKTTQAVLDALNAAGIHATFFVVATGYNDKYLSLIVITKIHISTSISKFIDISFFAHKIFGIIFYTHDITKRRIRHECRLPYHNGYRV